jgi:predicted acyl esterase
MRKIRPVADVDAVIGTGRISKRQYDIVLERDVKVAVSDGVSIDIDLVRPDADGKFPAVLSLSPYPKECMTDRLWPGVYGARRVRGTPDSSIEVGPIEFLVRRGYIQIVGSIRGTGKSGGTWRYMDTREAQDTYDLVEWAARQPWCNGNVGMMGVSYFACNQYPAAALKPPHLKAIMPFFGATDAYRDLWYHGGILSAHFLNFWASMTVFDLHTEEVVSRKEMGEEGFREALARALQDKDLIGHAPYGFKTILENPDALTNSVKVDAILHPTDGPYYRERSGHEDRIEIPTYLGCCWFNFNMHLPGTLRAWGRMKGPKKMVIGPPIYVDAPVHQYQWEIIRWFDYWLKGIDTGIMDEPPIRLFIPNSGEWKTAEEWPLPGTRWIPFHLHAGGILTDTVEPWPDAPSASYVDAPDNRGCLRYTTPALVEDTEVVGPIALTLYASCRSTDTNFFVSLWHVDPQGKETLLTRGWLKASHREIDPERSKPWQPYHPHTEAQLLLPGEVYEFRIEIVPTACLFPVGHRICLKVSGADDEQPRAMLDLIRGKHLWSQTPTTVTIYHDEDRPSYLLLPITRGNVVGTFLSGGDVSLRELEIV